MQDWLGDDKEKRHRREVHLPAGRFGEAIEQAQAALFLASDESSFVNGADFIVDGGMTKVGTLRRFTVWMLLLILHRPTSRQRDQQQRHRRTLHLNEAASF